MGISWHIGHCHRLHRWIRLMVTSPCPVAYIEPSRTMITSQHIGRFLVNINSIFPCQVNDICGVFSNRILSIGFLATKTSGDYLYCLEGLQNILTNNLRWCLPHLVLGICLATYDFWEEDCSLCMNTYTYAYECIGMYVYIYTESLWNRHTLFWSYFINLNWLNALYH